MNIPKMLEYATKMNIDFFEIEFTKEISGFNGYNTMTTFSELYKETNDPRHLEKSREIVEIAYNQYVDFFENGIGDSINNTPHMFAMACNNYGLILSRSYELTNDKSDLITSSEIHWKGYQMSPFYENICNAAWSANKAESYEKCIEYVKIYLKDYEGELDFNSIQQQYWYLINNYCALDQMEDAKNSYLLSKKLLEEHTVGNIDATDRFIYNAQEFFIKLNKLEDKSEFYINEMKWFVDQPEFETIVPKEYATIAYFYAEIQAQSDTPTLAIPNYHKCITLWDQHFDSLNGFYTFKLKKAKKMYRQLSGDQKSFPLHLEELFDEKELQNTKTYLLDPIENEANAQKVIEIVNAYTTQKDALNAWVDYEKKIYINIDKELHETGDCDYKITITLPKIENTDEFNSFTFEVFKNNILKGSYATFTAKQVSNYKALDDFQINGLPINRGSVFQMQAYEDAHFWWNEICNRFYESL